MDETYGTYVDDECFDIHDYDDDTDHILMMILTMILIMILMMILIMVGAGTCILSKFLAAVPGSLVLVVLGPWSLLLSGLAQKTCCVPKNGFRGNIFRPE